MDMKSNTVSIADLVSVIKSHKKLFITTFILIFALGMAYIVLKKPDYKFIAKVMPATYVEHATGAGNMYPNFNAKGGKEVAFEGIVSLQQKLTDYIIPSVIAEYLAANKGNPNAISPVITAKLNQNKSQLLLQAKGPEKNFAVYQQLYNTILDHINKEQAILLTQRKSFIQWYITATEKQLSSTLASVNFEKSQLAIVDKNKAASSSDPFGYSNMGISQLVSQLSQLKEKSVSLQNNLSLLQMQLKSIVTSHFQDGVLKLNYQFLGKFEFMILLLFLATLLSILIVFIIQPLRRST